MLQFLFLFPNFFFLLNIYITPCSRDKHTKKNKEPREIWTSSLWNLLNDDEETQLKYPLF